MLVGPSINNDNSILMIYVFNLLHLHFNIEMLVVSCELIRLALHDILNIILSNSIHTFGLIVLLIYIFN